MDGQTDGQNIFILPTQAGRGCAARVAWPDSPEMFFGVSCIMLYGMVVDSSSGSGCKLYDTVQTVECMILTLRKPFLLGSAIIIIFFVKLSLRESACV